MDNTIYDWYWTDVFEDACDFMDDYLDEETADQEYEEVFDTMWATDEVCGNGVDGHDHIYDEKVKAALFDEYIMGDIEAEFGKLDYDRIVGKGMDGIIYLDATIRCWMLGQLGERLEPLWNVMRAEYTDRELED